MKTLDDPWNWLAQQSLLLWSLLMLPLFITLETALLANLEHTHKTWKQLFATSLPRPAFLAAKQAAALGLIGLSTLVLVGLIVLVGLGLRLFLPELGFSAPIPWLRLLCIAGLVYLSSWLLVALHSWVSLRWPSFVVATGTGIVAVIVAIMLARSDWSTLYPWTLPGQVSQSLFEGKPDWNALALGSLGGAAVFLLSLWDLSRRDA
jgi:hypothetical protein